MSELISTPLINDLRDNLSNYTNPETGGHVPRCICMKQSYWDLVESEIRSTVHVDPNKPVSKRLFGLRVEIATEKHEMEMEGDYAFMPEMFEVLEDEVNE